MCNANMYLAAVNVVHLPGDSRDGEGFQYSALTYDALSTVKGKVGAAVGTDGHLQGRLGGCLWKGREPRPTVSTVDVLWIL